MHTSIVQIPPSRQFATRQKEQCIQGMLVCGRRSRPWVHTMCQKACYVMTLFVLVVVVLLYSLVFGLPNSCQDLGAPLRFARDGTFQIAIFEDLHFGESMIALRIVIVVKADSSRCLGYVGSAAGHQYCQGHERSLGRRVARFRCAQR